MKKMFLIKLFLILGGFISITTIIYLLFLNGKIYNYSCPENYSLKGNKCYFAALEEPMIKYSCISGYELQNEQCVNTIVFDAVIINECQDGYIYNEKSGCVKTEMKEAQMIYKCKNNKVVDDFYCYDVEYLPAKNTPYCSDDCILENDKCKCPKIYKPQHYTSNGFPICITSIGEKADLFTGLCHGFIYLRPNYKYNCEKGIKDGTKCKVLSNPTLAETDYTCSNGYYLDGIICKKDKTTSVNKKYICAEGYNLKGNKCYSSVNIPANKKLYCNDGYILKGDKCEKTIVIKANKN